MLQSVSELTYFPHLTEIYLSENPLCNNPNYHKELKQTLPQVQLIDGVDCCVYKSNSTAESRELQVYDRNENTNGSLVYHSRPPCMIQPAFSKEITDSINPQQRFPRTHLALAEYNKRTRLICPLIDDQVRKTRETCAPLSIEYSAEEGQFPGNAPMRDVGTEIDVLRVDNAQVQTEEAWETVETLKKAQAILEKEMQLVKGEISITYLPADAKQSSRKLIV